MVNIACEVSDTWAKFGFRLLCEELACEQALHCQRHLARGEFWLVVIIKVKVSSQAAAETHCWLQSHNVSLSLLGRPHHHLGSNQPTLLLLLLVQCCCCCCAALVAKLLLRTFSAHSALGLETRPTEMECFLMTGSGTEGRVATWWWRQSCWCRGGNELAGSAGAPHMVQKVHRPAKRGFRQSGEDVL